MKLHVRRAVDKQHTLRQLDVPSLNRRLKTFLRSNEAYQRYLPTETWLSGGCWLLAEALHQVLGGALVAIMSDRNVEHVALEISGWFIDGDGFSRRTTLMRRWSGREGVPNPTIVPLRQVESIVRARGDIPSPDERLTDLVQYVREQCGYRSSVPCARSRTRSLRCRWA